METASETLHLPSYSFYERHESAALLAKPEAVIDAVANLDMRADPVADALLSLRELPARLMGSKEKRAPFGFHSFTLLSRSQDELALGLIGRFWRLDFGLVPLRDQHAFLQFNDPGMAKLVLRFQAVPREARGVVLVTETFVHCPTLRTKLLFAPYWFVIRLASGWIRRRTLRMVERQLDPAT